VRGHPEISRLAASGNPGVLVRPDGYITLPLINDVKVSGLTFMQLKDRLTVLFSKRLEQPEVTVIGITLREPMVYVLGEVPNPRPVPLRQASTAFQAIAHAGGLKHTGVSNAIALIRLDDEGHLNAYKIAVDLEGQPAPYMALQATVLHSDDIILVPESDIAQFDRWISDYINQPLLGVNSVLAPVANYLLVQELMDDD
jgi:polysaccharide export outer membrane protein